MCIPSSMAVLNSWVQRLAVATEMYMVPFSAGRTRCLKIASDFAITNTDIRGSLGFLAELGLLTDKANRP